MRLQASDKSLLGFRAIVLLDGVRQQAVDAADEERGFVDVYAQPVEPRYSAPSTLCRHRLFGKVQIIDPQDLQTLTDVYSK